MSDIEISKKSIKLPISDILSKYGLLDDDITLYGKYKAKIPSYNNNSGRLVLVTAISPTPYGEGKTTVSIGLADALNKLGKKTIAVLREPSMGPVFGMKGGATGGGYSQVVPMEDINLHFTGDMHAITSANNLISAAIDNHIYFGNELDIQEVTFRRCLDVNDRALREVTISNRSDSFTITSASEVMALFCLSSSLDDLKERLSNIIVGLNSKSLPVYVKDLKLEGSLVALLKDAFLPNAVQTLENNLAIIHGGPFANIAHGCSSLVSIKTALSLSDYVVTEAGFGADLGAEKFFDILCRRGEFTPSSVVLVSTIKALKYHGGCLKEKIYEEDLESLEKGFSNLDKHYKNLLKFGVNVIIALNRFSTDTVEELNLFKNYCDKNNYSYALVDAYEKGSEGALDLAQKVIECESSNFHTLYSLDDSITSKINTICKDIYGASSVNYTSLATSKLEWLDNNNFNNLPICIAKTQYSFTDNPKELDVYKDFSVTVKDIKLYNGAGFITVYLGDIMVMPGLSRHSNYLNIDVVDGEIINLS